eukprot:465560-Pelagomonas_calceolata.AAC.1
MAVAQLAQQSRTGWHPCTPTGAHKHSHRQCALFVLNLQAEHSPHQLNFYKVIAHSFIIGNEGADACAQTAALMDITDISLPDAKDPFHN